MLVHNKGEFIRHIGVRLIPGANRLSEDDAAQFKVALEHPLNQLLVEEEEITYEDNGLADMAAAKAIKLVNDTYDLNTLEQFRQEEKRKTVLDAIEKQIESIKSPPEDKIVNPEE
ncbi:hypothetical protein [Heyndrickxia coagulans]|uniref:hypothetical protein n=1 Tax=Heyndrickxia coagulans TaxID=1398 RepID=UPI001459AD79|nr:hypothetical protein [Heyndrickxia coagulans]NMH83275.1 hypothetical protein [Heyndrickxia coagulans]